MSTCVAAIVTACVAVLGTAAVFVTDVPPGAALHPTCAWKGDRLVMSAVVMNEGRRATVVDIPAFSVRPSTFTYTYAHKRLVGNAISGCAAHVRSIPPPTGDD